LPELPEVEIVKRGLQPCLPGKEIESVELFAGHTVRKPSAQKFCAGLSGCTFEKIERRGKYLLFQMLGGKILIVHLGMSGRLLLAKNKGAPSTHIRMKINLRNNGNLWLQDPRRFSRVWLVDNQAKSNTVVPSLLQLGVEPLSENLTEEYLHTHFLNRKQNIKAVLLDQTVIAGIGNIYADESLFVARVHPLTSAQQLTRAQRERLINAAREVLGAAIENGGSTLRNYTDTSGTNGNYQGQAWVYGRLKQPCRICGTPIRKTTVMARSTHFCPRCQRASTSLKSASSNRR
jgi:formamidopyrimidine-DNA glycosylase